VSRKRYFAASNTESGFVSYFSENFRERSDRCYIIKGGPGTGKSRLMNELGEAFETSGGEVEYYYCSSDPSSLDGLFVKLGSESVSILDGTAPHAEDIALPGTVDNILDLGRFWDSRILRERRDEIDLLGRKKSSAYAAAYRALSAYGNLGRTADALIEECTDTDAIAEKAQKIAASLPKEKKLCSPISAIGMRGRVSFVTFRENSRLNISVTDSRGYGVSYLYFDRLIQTCGGGRIAPHPIMTGRYCGLLAGDISVTETGTTDAGDKAIDVSEFVDRNAYLSVKSRVERLRILADGALDEADSAFREAGEAHMKIEEIFMSAMNFEAKEGYSQELCSKIALGDL